MFRRSFDVVNFRVHCCFHTGPDFPVLLLICIGVLVKKIENISITNCNSCLGSKKIILKSKTVN